MNFYYPSSQFICKIMENLLDHFTVDHTGTHVYGIPRSLLASLLEKKLMQMIVSRHWQLLEGAFNLIFLFTKM